MTRVRTPRTILCFGSFFYWTRCVAVKNLSAPARYVYRLYGCGRMCRKISENSTKKKSENSRTRSRFLRDRRCCVLRCFFGWKLFFGKSEFANDVCWFIDIVFGAFYMVFMGFVMLRVSLIYLFVFVFKCWKAIHASHSIIYCVCV